MLEKPAGVVPNRSETAKEGTVQDWVEANFPLAPSLAGASPLMADGYPVGEEFLSRSGIVHRLDKETSGLMVVARNPAAFAALKRQWVQREVVKEYTVLVYGSVRQFLAKRGYEGSDEFTVDAPLDRHPKNPIKRAVVVGGRPAVTDFVIVQDFGDYTLLKARPKTGRTHQIRIHLAALGFPVVGDELYGGRKRSRESRTVLSRHFLHAGHLEFAHPTTGAPLRFDSPLPSELENFLKFFSKPS